MQILLHLGVPWHEIFEHEIFRPAFMGVIFGEKFYNPLLDARARNGPGEFRHSKGPGGFWGSLGPEMSEVTVTARTM